MLLRQFVAILFLYSDLLYSFVSILLQIAFVWIFLQELVTGKGVLKGIEEGDWFFLLNEGLFGIAVVGLTGWLAIKGDDDYTKE